MPSRKTTSKRRPSARYARLFPKTHIALSDRVYVNHVMAAPNRHFISSLARKTFRGSNG